MAEFVSTSRSSASRLGFCRAPAQPSARPGAGGAGDRRRTRRPGAPRRPEAGDGRRTSPRHDRGPPLGQRPARPPARAARTAAERARVRTPPRRDSRRLPRAPRRARSGWSALLGLQFVQRARVREGVVAATSASSSVTSAGGRPIERARHARCGPFRSRRAPRAAHPPRRGELGAGGTGGTGRADRSRPSGSRWPIGPSSSTRRTRRSRPSYRRGLLARPPAGGRVRRSRCAPGAAPRRSGAARSS